DGHARARRDDGNPTGHRIENGETYAFVHAGMHEDVGATEKAGQFLTRERRHDVDALTQVGGKLVAYGDFGPERPRDAKTKVIVPARQRGEGVDEIAGPLGRQPLHDGDERRRTGAIDVRRRVHGRGTERSLHDSVRGGVAALDQRRALTAVQTRHE